MDEIRQATNSNFALGNELFAAQVSAALGRRAVPGKSGRPCKAPTPKWGKLFIIGDVRDQTCIIVDDLVDTAGTLCEAARALKDDGAASVLAYCTHPVLSGNVAAWLDKWVGDAHSTRLDRARRLPIACPNLLETLK